MDEIQVLKKVMSDIQNQFYLIIGNNDEAETFEKLFQIDEDACVQAYMTTYGASLESTLDCLKEQDISIKEYVGMTSKGLSLVERFDASLENKMLEPNSKIFEDAYIECKDELINYIIELEAK